MTVTCPACGAQLQPGPDAMARCTCGFYGFSGYIQEYTYLNARLQWVKERLAEGAGPPDPATARAYGVWTPPPPAKVSTSPQTLLVTLGAGLLILAALVFVAVAWNTIGPAGQVGSLAALTVGIAVAAILSRRRTHRAAEALAAVAFCLGLICVSAAPALGAVPQAWDSGRHPYRLIVYGAAWLWGVGAGRRFGLLAWSWLGWLLTPLVLGMALILGLQWVSNDEISATVSGVVFLASGLLILRTAGQVDLWPMRMAGALCLTVAGALLLVALTYDPPAGAVLLVAAGLLATVVVGLPWVGWPLFGFWLALLAGFAPQAAGTTALVGLAGAGLLFALYREGPLLAVTSASSLWSTYVLSTAESPELLALIAGLALLAFALLKGAAPVSWLGAALTWIAFLVYSPQPPFFEGPLLVLAALLLIAGVIMRRAGIRNSGIVFGPAVSAALIPPAILCWWQVWQAPALIRFGLVMALGVSLLVVGVRKHLLGLVVPSTIAVSIAATAQIFATFDLLPRWLALAIAGAALIAIGARLEWVRERGRDTEEWLQNLK